MHVRQTPGGRADRLGHAQHAVANRHHPAAAGRIQVSGTCVVDDVHPLAALGDGPDGFLWIQQEMVSGLVTHATLVGC